MSDPTRDASIVLDALPTHPAPNITLEDHRLNVCGAVRLPAEYALSDLAMCPQVELVQDFTCEEGWVVPEQRWRGVSLGTLLDRAHPDDGTQWVTLAGGDFSIVLSLEEANGALIALSLNDGPLAVEHGGPMRVLVQGGLCYTSIKWLDRIEVTTAPAVGTAPGIALRRIGLEPG